MDKWESFIKKLKSFANPEDQSQIVLNDFSRLIKIYGGKLTAEELEEIRLTFPGKEIDQSEHDASKGPVKTLNIARIYGVKYTRQMDKLYKKIDVEKDGAADDMFDPMGFLGRNKFQRPKIQLKPISEEEFYMNFIRNNKLKEIMLNIRQVDTDHKKYVTNLELDDIIKISYPNLIDRDLMPILDKHAYAAMKIWISYPRWRDSCLEWMEKLGSKVVTPDNSNIQKQIQNL